MELPKNLAMSCVSKEVRELLSPLQLSESVMQDIMKTLEQEMDAGLSADEEKQASSSLLMENTYVLELLNGSESGKFLALDLGGTNFRVLLCEMSNGKCSSISRNYNVPDEKLHQPAAVVFDHLADSIHCFLAEEGMLTLKADLPLGFTFSFPMRQHSLRKGILVTWTKSFACPDGVGSDAVAMLEDAMKRRGDLQHVKVVAILNDTTGTLMAGSYLDSECQIGLILGTGCNAAYVEDARKVDKSVMTGASQMVVDTEWGAFGDNGSLDFLKTDVDNCINQHSNHTNSFTFEKLFSGHYIGDVVRLFLLKLHDAQLLSLLPGNALHAWSSVTAHHISTVLKDDMGGFENTVEVLKELGIEKDAADVMHYLCSCVTWRGAQLIGSCIVVLLQRMKRSNMTVAIDGSLYRYNSVMHDWLMRVIRHLEPNVNCKLILAEDGSGRGAAMVAAVAARLQSQSV